MIKELLHKSVLLLVCLLGMQCLYGQEFLVKDINPGVGWSSIDFKFRIGADFYFVASGDLGREFWISDGTPTGTTVLKDINPGAFNDSDPDDFFQYNGTWFFTADDGTNGRELWTTDGTANGTLMFKDIYPGVSSGDPSEFVILNGILYFSANDGTSGVELWKSDGTVGGTVMVADIFAGISNSFPKSIVALGNEIAFAANDGINGEEIWKSDGTSAGTSLIHNIAPAAVSSFPKELTSVGNKVFFIADDGVLGKEVWRTDGTSAGTTITTDVLPGGGHPDVSDLNAVGDYLFFVADNGSNGIELFRSDANAQPALSEIVEIFPDTFGATPKDFIMLNGDMIFNANSGVEGFELWKAQASDGSVSMVKDIFPGFSSSSPVMLEVLNNNVIFKARSANIGFELWKTDGTDAGTVLIADMNTDPSTNLSNSDPTNPVIKDNILYFSATDYINGYQIWRTDGTTSATQRLTSIPHDTIFTNTHKPVFINNLGNSVINFIGLGDPFGEELWGANIIPIDASDVTTNSPLNCNGDTDGTIDIVVTGGVGDPSCFTYTWSDPSLSGLNLTGLAAGSYTLTVSDCVGFQTITTISIVEPDPVSGAAMETSTVSCNGLSDGQAAVGGSGGTSPYTYLWDNGQTGPTVTGLNAGTHSVTITDANGCTGLTTVLSTEPIILQASTAAGATICLGAFNGQATVTPSGGTSPYTFLWDNNETTASATMLSGGTHIVTVTDANNCTETSIVTIAEYAEMSVGFTSQDVSCIDGSNGSATASVSGGSGTGHTYAWADGSTTATISNLPAGTYCVTATDDAGCSESSCVVILTPLIAVNQTSTGAVSCFGGSDGEASVVITNANSTYTYAWDNGETMATATMLNAGQHMVTITDALNCSTIETVTITEAPVFVFVDSLSTAPSCFGANDGSVTYNFAGGTSPYVYNWSTGLSTSTGTLSGLSGNATYCATITDANNCAVFNFCSSLTEPAQISASLTSPVGDVSCFGVCDGTANINVAAGANYTFTWSSGETNTGMTSSASALCEGLNNVTITDGTCTVVNSYLVNSPEEIVPTTVVSDNTCFGDSIGSVTVTAAGGTGPYTYAYSNGSSNLPAGNYSVTITDANLCQTIEPFSIAEPGALSINFNTQLPSCIGAADGGVSPVPSGGTAPYTFQFSAGPTGLAAGNYMATVTDANNCQTVSPFTITDPAPIQIANAVTDISCFGQVDGSVSSTASGGTGPYTYNFSAGPNGLAAGTYMVTATDANGCMQVDSFMVTEPSEMATTVTTVDASCFGVPNGSASVTTSGGTGPYSYSYSNGSANLTAGSYAVTTMDDNGCTRVDSFEITEPPMLDLMITTIDLACFGDSDGSASVVVTGGTPPYTFNDTYTDLPAGSYPVTVTDANNCEIQSSFDINEPEEIDISTSSTDATNNLADGTATVTPAGGIMPYTYAWNTTPVQTSATATDLIAGDYEVTITDANGCEVITTVTVDMIVNTTNLDQSLLFNVFPNPAKDQAVLDLAFSNIQDVELRIFDALGRVVYFKSLDAVQREEVNLDLKRFGQGVYWISLKSTKGQYVRKLSVIKQ